MSNAKRKRKSQLNANNGESSGDESQFNLEQDDEGVNEDVINSFNEIGKGYADPKDASKASMFHQ